MVLSVDIGLAALTGSAFAAGALIQPLLLWFGLKGLGKIAGPKGIWAGVVAAVAILALHQVGTLRTEEYKAFLITLLLVLAAGNLALWLWSASNRNANQTIAPTQGSAGPAIGSPSRLAATPPPPTPPPCSRRLAHKAPS